ncbi:MAG: tyrosine-type recombinase/integrase [Gemmatimonadetes bacterium]|nr:tyrosine-type recombinase/integrase [Gemmatimonadota bacterium]MBA4159811.1 tyrosine-type recombinase/integrase [Gemmatimonadota bacterium]
MNLLEEYSDWIQRAGPRVAASSARNYRAAVREYIEHFGDPVYATDATVEKWRRYIDSTHRNGVVAKASASAINVKVVALRALFQFLIERGLRKDNPAQRLTLPRKSELVPECVREQEVNALVEADSLSLQDRAMVEVLIGSGLRRSETAHLCLGQVASPALLRVVGTGGRERLAPLTDAGYAALRDWALHEHGDNTSAKLKRSAGADAAFEDLCTRRPGVPFFINGEGVPLPQLKFPGNVIYKRWKFVCEQLGLPPTTNPRKARNYFGAALVNEGANLKLIQEAMGHKSIVSTTAYTKVPSPSAAGIEALRGLHPRQKMEG